MPFQDLSLFRGALVLETGLIWSSRRELRARVIISIAQGASPGMWNQACGGFFVWCGSPLDADAEESTEKSESVSNRYIVL